MINIRKRKPNDNEAEIRKGELIVERIKLAVEIAKASAELALSIAQARFPLHLNANVGGTFQKVEPIKKEAKVFNINVDYDEEKQKSLLESLKKVGVL